MERDLRATRPTSATHPAEPAATAPSWTRPQAEVISLACEISAYAPDDGGPLF